MTIVRVYTEYEPPTGDPKLPQGFHTNRPWAIFPFLPKLSDKEVFFPWRSIIQQLNYTIGDLCSTVDLVASPDSKDTLWKIEDKWRRLDENKIMYEAIDIKIVDVLSEADRQGITAAFNKLKQRTERLSTARIIFLDL